LTKKTDSPPKDDYLKSRLDELFSSMPVIAPDVPPALGRPPTGTPRPRPASPALPAGEPAPGPYQQAFDNLAFGMLLLDLEGRLLRANPALCRQLGYTRLELVGRSYQDLVHPHDLKDSAGALRTMLLGAARTASIESRLQRKDGEYAWFELHLALVADSANRPAYISLVALDASQQRLAAELQRRLHELENLSQRQQQELDRLAARPLTPLAPPSGEAVASPDASLSPSPLPPPSRPQPAAQPLQPAAGPSPTPVVQAPTESGNPPKSAAADEKRARPLAPLTPTPALALPGLEGTQTYASPWARLSASLAQISFAVYLTLYLLGIALAEFVTTFDSPQLGLVIHGGLLVLFILHASIGASQQEQKFLFTLALAPLIRLISLSMPLLQFQFTYWYLVIGAPLFLSVWLVFRLTGYTPAEVGLALGRQLPLQIAVALTGVVLGYLEYKILKPQPLVETFSLQAIWLPALILLVFTGFLEELIFRGLMQRASLPTIGRLGLVYVSLLFGVLHIGYRSLADLVFVFLVGLFFSLIVERTRSIFGVTLAHGLTNITLFLIFPFLPY
jgi:PAS domain S-box-containing protein